MNRFLSTLLLLCVFQSAWATLDEDWLRAIGGRDVTGIERLLGRGANVNLSTKDGKTALMVAAQQGRTDVLVALLDAGADIDQRNTRGGTALMYAAVPGARQAVELLLSRGAAINLQSSNGWTALMIAAVKGHEELVRTLLSHGADANLADIYGWTALMRATAENRLAVVHILLDSKSVNVNARNDAGATALHVAAEKGSVEIARLLIINNADVQSTDRMGRTPRMIAEASSQNDIVDLIKRMAAERQGSKRPR